MQIPPVEVKSSISETCYFCDNVEVDFEKDKESQKPAVQVGHSSFENSLNNFWKIIRIDVNNRIFDSRIDVLVRDQYSQRRENKLKDQPSTANKSRVPEQQFSSKPF